MPQNPTPNLGLIKPNKGEYRDSWHIPMNKNADTIDTEVGTLQSEVVAARGAEVDLNTRLSVSLNADGTLVASKEMVDARNSPVYGDEDSTPTNFDIRTRISQADWELYYGREGAAALRDALAVRAYLGSAVLSGSKDANGNPTWMSSAGANVTVDGSVTPVVFMIGGYLGRVRTAQATTATGGAGKQYLYATYNANGLVRVDGSGGTNGTVSADTSTKARLLVDNTIDFTSRDVKAGDVLTILGSSGNAGKYVVKTVAPGGNHNALQIYGVFPGGVLTGLSYTVADPLAVTLALDSTGTVSGRFYVGEIYFDGASITSSGSIPATRALMFRDTYVGDWKSVDVSGVNPTFELAWNHNFLTSRVQISVQVIPTGGSTTDETQILEELAPGCAVDALHHNVLMKWDKYQVTLKNPVNNVFYRDYSGSLQTGGFIRVIVRKRGA